MLNRSFLLALLLLQLASPLQAPAGTLDDFEREARSVRPAAEATATGTDESHESDDCDDKTGWHPLCDLGEAVVGGIVYLVALPFIEGGKGSVARLRGETAEGKSLNQRKVGDPDLPGIALFVGRETANDGIRGQEMQLEVGHGFLGLRGKAQRLEEPASGDALDLQQAHLLFRGTYGPVQVDIGGGRMWLEGDTHARGRSVLLGASVFLTQQLSVHATGSNGRFGGNDVRELDGALGWHRRHGGIRLGYKRNSAGPVDIEGPYAGLTLFY